MNIVYRILFPIIDVLAKVIKTRPTVIRSETGDILRANWLPEENDLGKQSIFSFVSTILGIWNAFIPDFLRPILELLHFIPFFYFYAGLTDVEKWMSRNYAAIGMLLTCLSLYVTMEGDELVERFNPRNW